MILTFEIFVISKEPPVDVETEKIVLNFGDLRMVKEPAIYSPSNNAEQPTIEPSLTKIGL